MQLRSLGFRSVTAALILTFAGCATTQPASSAPPSGAQAQELRQEYTSQTVEISARPEVTERFELLTPQQPKAVIVSFTGGDGRVYWQYATPGNSKSNFLERNRTLFAERGFVVASIAPPSDRTVLTGFRETADHVQDIHALIVWLRQKFSLPVWLLGTSAGTMSVAYAAIELTGSDGPDGIVLTSSVLNDSDDGTKTNLPLPDLAVDKIQVPVLVVHHEMDGCGICRPSVLPVLMRKLTSAPRKELWTVNGGQNIGDPCQPQSYHGFNGVDEKVINKVADWISTVPASSSQ